MRNKVVFFRDRFWICRYIFWEKVSPWWILTEGKEFSLKIFKRIYICIRNKTCFTIFLSLKKHKIVFEKRSKRLWLLLHDLYFFMKMPPFPSEIFGSSRRRKNDGDMTKQGCMAYTLQETRANDCCVPFWPSNLFVSFIKCSTFSSHAAKQHLITLISELFCIRNGVCDDAWLWDFSSHERAAVNPTALYNTVCMATSSLSSFPDRHGEPTWHKPPPWSMSR